MSTQLHIIQQTLRRFCGFGFVVLFAVMSTFASGTMLEKGEQGVSVVICTAAGVHTIQVDADGNPIAPQHTPCEWAAPSVAIDMAAIDVMVRGADYARVVHLPIVDWMHPAIAQTQLNNRGPPTVL